MPRVRHSDNSFELKTLCQGQCLFKPKHLSNQARLCTAVVMTITTTGPVVIPDSWRVALPLLSVLRCSIEPSCFRSLWFSITENTYNQSLTLNFTSYTRQQRQLASPNPKKDLCLTHASQSRAEICPFLILFLVAIQPEVSLARGAGWSTAVLFLWKLMPLPLSPPTPKSPMN